MDLDQKIKIVEALNKCKDENIKFQLKKEQKSYEKGTIIEIRECGLNSDNDVIVLADVYFPRYDYKSSVGAYFDLSHFIELLKDCKSI